ncbi:hypothetical protein HID58_031966 [Brassica napus]|uniref:Uncharacterized protein n=1 Tax=Brassica napus TaxID=3708 RepID=A0ABQ8BV11_BRANA|nr:hypothetical protein HID58_031966 [Brassica napus]
MTSTTKGLGICLSHVQKHS